MSAHNSAENWQLLLIMKTSVMRRPIKVECFIKQIREIVHDVFISCLKLTGMPTGGYLVMYLRRDVFPRRSPLSPSFSLHLSKITNPGRSSLSPRQIVLLTSWLVTNMAAHPPSPRYSPGRTHIPETSNSLLCLKSKSIKTSLL